MRVSLQHSVTCSCGEGKGKDMEKKKENGWQKVKSKVTKMNAKLKKTQPTSLVNFALCTHQKKGWPVQLSRACGCIEMNSWMKLSHCRLLTSTLGKYGPLVEELNKCSSWWHLCNGISCTRGCTRRIDSSLALSKRRACAAMKPTTEKLFTWGIFYQPCFVIFRAVCCRLKDTS